MSSIPLLQWSEEDRTRVYSNHGKTAADIEQDIKNIQEWMSKQPHLPEIPDGEVILRFLVINKFRVEVVKEKLDNYYTIRGKIPEFYNKLPTSPEIQNLMDVVSYVPLPKLTEDLNRVMIVRVRDTDVDKFDATLYFAYLFSATEIRLRHEMQLREIQIYDLDGIKLGHLTKFSPMVLKKAVVVLEKVFSNSVKEFHIINAPGFVDSFVTLIKSFMKPKLAERFHAHKGVDTLLQMVSKDILPKDYGGEEKSISELTEDWKKLFKEKEEIFKHLQTLKVKEELRPGKSIIDDIFGVEGNFRQLSVD